MSDYRAFIGATLVHVILFGVVFIAPQRRVPSAVVPAPPSIVDEIAILTDGEVHGDDPKSLATSEASPPSAKSARANALETTRGREPTPPSSPEESQTEPVTPRVAMVMPPPAIGLALGAANRFVVYEAPPDAPPSRGTSGTSRTSASIGARPSAPTPAEAKRNVEASLRAAARERDSQLGLGPDGPVRTALGEATSASTAPVNGHAVFLATADESGTVVSMTLLRCSAASSDWERAAAVALASLTGVRLRLPSTARSAKMKIMVVSAYKMPSGHDPGVTTGVLGLPVTEGEDKAPTRVTILSPIPKLQNVDVEIAPGLKARIAEYRWDLLKVEGDPVDIGARPRRVVHTQLVESKVL